MSEFWQFSYARHYYLTHPWAWLKDLYRSFKFAWQRAFRGWDDTVIWSIDDYLVTMLPVWLRVLKEDKVGVPVITDVGETPLALPEEKWDRYLDLMIEGFESAKMLISDEIPIHQEAWALYEQRAKHESFDEDIELYSNIIDELGGRERVEAERKALHESFLQGIKLFTEYFFALWD